MDEEEIVKLSEEEIQKIERVSQAIKDRLDAEANLESQRKFRILFQRAPKVTLPFIVYVIYMGVLALGVLWLLLQYTDVRLWFGGFLLLVIMIAPLFVLPHEDWKKLLRYIKKKLTKSSIEEEKKRGKEKE